VDSSSSKSVSEIVELASAFYGSAVLFAALEHNVFAAVEKSGDLADIVKETGCSERGLRLLLDACVAEGLLTKDGRTYYNTGAGKAALVPGGPADLSKAIRYNRDVYPAWGNLAKFVSTGRPTERPEIHLGEDAARTKAFAAAMFGRAMGIGRSIVPLLGLDSSLGGRRSEVRGQTEEVENSAVHLHLSPSPSLKILDLAGGPAAYAILMCQACPGATCVTVDLPAISAEAKSYVAQFGLADRIECRAGDYHTDEYESGSYDIVTIFGALHQESPAAIVDILKRARRALKKGGRLLVLDVMSDATHTAPKFSALFAVNMALTTQNGWVFSDEELKGWMREAGFDPAETQRVPPPMPHWLVSATAR